MQGVQHKKQYYLKYLLWYSLAFALVTALVFFVFLVQGRSLVWGSDAVAQYVPKAAYFGTKTREMLTRFLHGDFTVPMYDFALGMGNAIPIQTEPLYWLFLLFPAKDAELAFAVVLLARFYFAGLSMSAFLLYFRNGRAAALLGSFAYIYCDYGMWGCMRNAQFIVGLIFLPLGILCIEEICRRKHWYLFTVYVWLHLWASYYFLYMNTIAMGVYFLIRFFGTREGRAWKEFWLRMRTIVCSYLLGVAIGNMRLVTSFASYLSSSRTEAMEYGSAARYFSYGLKWPARFFGFFLTAGRGPGHWLRLGFIPLVYAALVLLFVRRGRKQLKAAVVTAAACCMLPVVAFVFSGFSSINNRWCYILAFVMASVLGFAAKDLLALSKKERIILFAACLPCFLMFAYYAVSVGGKHRTIALVSALVLALTLAVIEAVNRLRFSQRQAWAALLVLAMISHWAYGLEEYAPRMGNVASEFPKAGTVVDSITQMPLAAISGIQDDTFYRSATSEVSKPVQGASQFLNYYGTVYYTSTISKIIQNFYAQMALCTWSAVRLRGFDGRAIPNLLACVKYYALEKGREEMLPYGYVKIGETDGEEAYELYENRLALPLGYTYDRVISQEDLLAFDHPKRQEMILQAAVLEDTAGLSATDGQDLQITGSMRPITGIETENLTITDHAIVTGKDAAVTPKLTIHFDGTAESEVYLYLKGLRCEKETSTAFTYACGENQTHYNLHGTNNIYWTKQNAYLFHMGYHTEKTDCCTITFDRNVRLDFEDLQIYCQPMSEMEAYADHLKEDVLTDIEMFTNGVKGKISLDTKKLLVLSIPYQSGWTAYVDEQKTDLLKANVMYMGLALDAGVHRVELRYREPGIRLSLIISAAGIIILITALAIRRRKNAA